MKIHYAALLLLLLLPACSWFGFGPSSFDHKNASGYYASDAEQCVPYARRVSGIELYGDADSWWQKAEGKYERGQVPREGAVLVLMQTPRMRSGHVAVVKDILGTRQISVTQTNWGETKKKRRIVYESQLAEDVSNANDWTSVRFWNDEKGVMGFPYAAYGFIYQK